MRFLIKRLAVVLAGGTIVLGTAPATANAQKALVYCPVTVDATGCTAIANALAASHPLGVDRAFDGTNGTVDLKTVELFKYSVFVVPSLADDATAQPYALLRDPEVVEHLRAALIGRIALWSGTPDQGATNRAMKDALVQNLVAYAGGAYAAAKGPGLVALLDASSNAASRYDWVRAVTPLPVTADPNLLIYSGVRALNQTGTSILASGLGPIAYTNMATFGFQVPNGAAGVSLDAVGQTGTAMGGQVVLVTMEGGNTDGATVMTDRLDYAPGEMVTITGAGWEPGETVRMTLHEDPLVHEDRVLTSVADGNGNFTNTEFAPEEHHLGVRFVLTAIGQTSGRRAQTTFTDSRTITAATVNGGLSTTVPAGATISATVSVTTATGGGNANWRSTGWRISTTGPGAITCVDHPNHDGVGSYSETFSMTAPAESPTAYNAYFIAYQDDGCSAQPSTPFTLTNAVVSLGDPTVTTISPTSKTYGDAGFTLTVNGTNFFSGSVVTFNGADRVTTVVNGSQLTAEILASDLLSVGTGQVRVRNSLTSISSPISFSVTARPITVTADPKNKVYGNADPALTYQITSGSLVGSDAFSGALTRDPGENVGAYQIQQGTLALSTNYTLTFVPANLTITQRPLTITADPKAKTYGDADPGLTYQLTTGTLVSGDSFTGALGRVAGENVGTHAITQGTLTAGANYAITFVSADLTVSARPITLTADANSKVYGNADPTLTYQVTAGSLAFSDVFTGALARAAGENVGTYAIGQGTLSGGTNYTVTFVGANLAITARPITVTADPKSKVYGDADPALSYQLTSGTLVGTDALTGALTRVSGENVGTYAIQQGTLTAGANYELTFVPASLEITPRPITVTADAKSKVYGDPDPAFTYQVTSGNLAGGDAFSGALTRAAGENVGTYAITQGTLTAGTNYTLTFVGANLTITVRPITVTADPKSKIYGDADPALTYQITSGALAFSDAFSGALARVAGETVGTYAIQQGTLVLSANYNLSFVAANLTINPRPITVTADGKTKVYGDPDPALTYQLTSGTLVDENDLTGALARATGESVGTYAITQGTLAATTNYTLTFVPATLAITQRPITITADAKSKVYGDADPALTYQLTSGTLVGADALSGTLARAVGQNVGLYAIQQGTVTAGANYDLTYVGANLEITKRALTVTADDHTKIAGAVNPSLTGVIAGIQYSDAITATYSTTAVTLSLPGAYPITPALTPAAVLANYTPTLVNGTLTVTANAAPVLGTIMAPLLPTALGTAVNVSVPFTDVDVPASQPYTATIDWGNGTTSTSSFTDVGTITGSKTYPAVGVYTITVTITQDNFPATHSDTKEFEYYVVVYDPNGGFVTGGGWINSPAGAYPASPSLTGKANFGFVAKYKKGQTTPDGNTEFQFHAAGMNFKSSAYEWLVVAGARAQFKGTGTINGAGSYGFILTAIDGQIAGGGGTDKFRIKIWDVATGATMYDNQVTSDTSDAATPTTTLAGGSINIQTK